MNKRPRSAGDSTRAVHGGERDHQTTDSVTTPIHQTSTYWFANSEEIRAYQEGRSERDEYGRYGNPTCHAVERKLCELENSEAAILFASGMCATTTLLLALLPRGSHLIITSDCYRRTRQFVEQFLTKLGIETTVIDPGDSDKLRNALRDDTRLFFTESPTNPRLRVIDVATTADICHRRNTEIVIDATFATPLNQRPLDDGADYVVHSATKYLAGHNDLLAGVVLGSKERIAPIRQAVDVLGGILDPHAAYLLLRGIKTLALRMQRHNDNGMRIAKWLEAHPRVRRVWYPGLASHPDHAIAKRSMSGFGGVVTFELECDLEGAFRFTDACRIPYLAPSLGGVESLIESPALVSYWDRSPAERKELGIGDSMIRLSCGIEDADDLIADLEQAFGAI